MDVASTDAATNALSAAIANEVAASGSAIEARTAEKAPGLATGQYAPGGYTYNRTLAPAVPVLQSALVTAAKQALFRQAAKNAINDAQVGYDTARANMNQRQRDAQRKAAEEARRRQAEYDRQMRAYQQAATTSNGGSSAPKSTVSGVNVVSTGAPKQSTVSIGKATSGNVVIGKAPATGKVVVGKAPQTGKVVIGKAPQMNYVVRK